MNLSLGHVHAPTCHSIYVWLGGSNFEGSGEYESVAYGKGEWQASPSSRLSRLQTLI